MTRLVIYSEFKAHLTSMATTTFCSASEDLASTITDLNPIEMVWDQLGRRVKEKQPTSAQHLWEVLQDVWKTIPGDDLMKLTERSQECAKQSSRQKGATLKNIKY